MFVHFPLTIFSRFCVWTQPSVTLEVKFNSASVRGVFQAMRDRSLSREQRWLEDGFVFPSLFMEGNDIFASKKGNCQLPEFQLKERRSRPEVHGCPLDVPSAGMFNMSGTLCPCLGSSLPSDASCHRLCCRSSALPCQHLYLHFLTFFVSMFHLQPHPWLTDTPSPPSLQ